MTDSYFPNPFRAVPSPPQFQPSEPAQSPREILLEPTTEMPVVVPAQREPQARTDEHAAAEADWTAEQPAEPETDAVPADAEFGAETEAEPDAEPEATDAEAVEAEPDAEPAAVAAEADDTEPAPDDEAAEEPVAAVEEQPAAEDGEELPAAEVEPVAESTPEAEPQAWSGDSDDVPSVVAADRAPVADEGAPELGAVPVVFLGLDAAEPVAEAAAQPVDAAEGEPVAEAPEESSQVVVLVVEEIEVLTEEELFAGGPSAEQALSEPAAEPVAEAVEEVTVAEEIAAVAPVSAPSLRPGDLAENHIAVWDPVVSQQFRDSWRELQVRFVDDPELTLTDAQALIAQAVQTLAQALLAEQDRIDPRTLTESADTETLRIAFREYRNFLDRVLAL